MATAGRRVLLLGTAILLVVVVSGAVGAQEATPLDRIADGTYEGAITDTQYQDDFPVLDTSATLVKDGDRLQISWSVTFQRAEAGCAYTNRDTWSSTGVVQAVGDRVRLTGDRRQEVGDECPDPVAIPTESERAYSFDLVGGELRGDIGVATLAFPVTTVDGGAVPDGAVGGGDASPDADEGADPDDADDADDAAGGEPSSDAGADAAPGDDTSEDGAEDGAEDGGGGIGPVVGVGLGAAALVAGAR